MADRKASRAPVIQARSVCGVRCRPVSTGRIAAALPVALENFAFEADHGTAQLDVVTGIGSI